MSLLRETVKMKITFPSYSLALCFLPFIPTNKVTLALHGRRLSEVGHTFVVLAENSTRVICMSVAKTRKINLLRF